MFGWKHCVECQRAYVKKHDGVDIPPPPANLPPGVVPGQVVHQHGNVGCAACQAGEVIVGPVTYVDQAPPGHAVVGGPMMVANNPGYAVVGGAMPAGMPGLEPTPVGVANATANQWNGSRMAAAGPRGAGPYDPSVMPTSTIPPQTALGNPAGNRPHVLSHMLGFGGLAKRHREAREDKDREHHAAIAYDPPAKAVTELPASMVYGQGH
jgi:hypothetical protein